MHLSYHYKVFSMQLGEDNIIFQLGVVKHLTVRRFNGDVIPCWRPAYAVLLAN